MAEYLDIVDEHGNPTGETVDRETAHREGIRHRTSHVWIARMKNGRVQVLLQKRCQNKDSFPGCYDISSAGHIPAGDDWVVSAIRELGEELGVSARAEQLISCGDRYVEWNTAFRGKPFHDRQVSRVFLLWLDREEADFVPQPEELESVKWMDLDACMEGVKNSSFPNCIVMEELEMVKKTAGEHPCC